ncbi:MAG: alpha/beta hydrolase [Bacteroidota bacterium]
MLNYKTVLKSEQSPWVVFIHGAGGSLKTWLYQEQAYGQHFNLLLIDLRDHGESKQITPLYEHYNFELISADIKVVVDKVGITRAHFMTLSFGSVLLQDFSKRYPDLIDKIIIAGGIFKGNLAIKSFVHLARFFNLFLKYETMYKLFSYLLMPRERNQKARRLYQMQAKKLTQKEYMKWVGLYAEFFKLLKAFYNQKLPNDTLVIMGSDDFVFLKSAKSFAKRQPTARLIQIPMVGHICNIEAPEEFNSLSLSFLLRE